MRISRGVLLAAALAVAGCDGLVDVGRAAPTRVAVADGSVVVAGPPGYCVDTAGSRGGFVLLGSCASISRNAALPHPADPGVLTVTVSRGRVRDPGAVLDDVETMFRSAQGRAMLSGNGRAAAVEVLETRRENGVLFAHIRDRSGRVPGAAEAYWRAIMVVGDRLLTVSVVGYEGAPLGAAAGRDTLAAFAGRIRAENPGA